MNRSPNETLNEIRDKAVADAIQQGFHNGKPEKINIGECLMLVVSELSEAFEASRDGKWSSKGILGNPKNPVIRLTEFDPNIVTKEFYESHIKGTVEEGLADVIIRITDIAVIYGIDLNWHIAAKIAYNETRPYKHGKKYG
jgi:NTP pyrophosphatase (non-canonical NTP hydrolase)